MDKEIAVYQRYAKGAIERENDLCCPTSYNPEYLKVIPDEILQKDYGCGDPSAYVKKGETVLDLGSGGGKLCYIIAQIVGPSGKVIGIDMNDDMLSLARKYKKEVGDKLGYHNVEFKKAKIQNLKLDLEKVDEYLKNNPITSTADLIKFNSFVETHEKYKPLIPDNSIDVVVSNCVLNLVKPEDKEKLFQEIYRVLKNGGRAVISDIISDEDVPEYMQNDPELWSGCISGALREDIFLKAFEDAGFHGIEILKWDEKPWRIVDGIEFRSVTVVAYKGKKVACIDLGQAVIYRGPYKKVEDDDGHVFERGKRIAVCDKTFNILKASYGRDFIFVDPCDVSAPKPFPCDAKIIYRHPRETKGADFLLEANVSICCTSGRCDYEPFAEKLKRLNKSLKKDNITTIQVNLGNLCNQSCIHCHVEASPEGNKIMSWEIMEDVINLLKNHPGLNLDITGGTPELHPHIEDFISQCSLYADSIYFRSNLTALFQKQKLIKILKNFKVELICSLPDISPQNTDYQRGKGVFEKSIHTLKILNDAGYGDELGINLVHNPTGFVLPELHEIIEERYKCYLKEEYGISFNRLFVLNNMPIGRFRKTLERYGNYETYMNMLCSSFNPSTIDALMCRYMLNVGWDGILYDCDFNNALNLPIHISKNVLKNLNLHSLTGNYITVGDHCYGCTAMKGSGCFGNVIK